MAVDPRKRQKKLQRRKAKDKARNRQQPRDPKNVMTRLQMCNNAPILHCRTTTSLWDGGMANVIVSRELSNGQVLYVIFLVDTRCLGVKNVAIGMKTKREYLEDVVERAFFDSEDLEPAAAKKLIEGAVSYAHDLGLKPYKDYLKAKLIFGDVDASQSDEEFEYGQNGLPTFIPGPHDSPARCANIMGILSETCGPDKFHYILPVEMGNEMEMIGEI